MHYSIPTEYTKAVAKKEKQYSAPVRYPLFNHFRPDKPRLPTLSKFTRLEDIHYASMNNSAATALLLYTTRCLIQSS